jgi:hypothetical protein
MARALQVNDLCLTQHSVVPANNGRLVVITDHDPLHAGVNGLSPYRIRDVTGGAFSTINISTGIESAGRWPWCARMYLKRVDAPGLDDELAALEEDDLNADIARVMGLDLETV